MAAVWLGSFRFVQLLTQLQVVEHVTPSILGSEEGAFVGGVGQEAKH